MRKEHFRLSMLIAALVTVAISVLAFFPANHAFAAYDSVMNNGSVPNTSATTTTMPDGSNSFTHALYYTAQGSDGTTYTSNYSTTNPAVEDSVLNLDKMTPDADGNYHFNAVLEITATNNVSNINYDLTMPSSGSQITGNPNVQFDGAPTFSGTDAASVQAATTYSNISSPGAYINEATYKNQYGQNMPNVYYMYLHGNLSAGQKLTVTIPYLLTNASALDLSTASPSVSFNESVSINPWTIWGQFTGDLTAANLRFARTDSTPVSNRWALYDILRDQQNGVANATGIRYLFTKNNNISTGTSLDYTLIDVLQKTNAEVGLDSSDYEYKNSDSPNYVPVNTMISDGTIAYARGGYYRLKLDKIKRAYAGTGWSTNGMYSDYYTYTTTRSGLVIHGAPTDPDGTYVNMNVELWQYIGGTSNICLTVGQQFDPKSGISYVRPYNRPEITNPLDDPVQSTLIDVSYTDAQGNTVANINTAQPGAYTVTYRYWFPTATNTRSNYSATFDTKVYVTAQQATQCPPDFTATVSYNTNGGEGSVTSQSVTYTPSAAGEVTLSNGSELTRDGYTLKGWNTRADGTGVSYALGAHMSDITSDVTLYAVWEKNSVAPVVPVHPSQDSKNAKSTKNLAHTGADITTIMWASTLLIAAGAGLIARVAWQRKKSE
ncbi:InlB B-repeat-containing protein [Alloscardovia theropitheci]|nr:InlB B-repeat-containing protein [Alloscardovia theropitheci]